MKMLGRGFARTAAVLSVWTMAAPAAFAATPAMQDPAPPPQDQPGMEGPGPAAEGAPGMGRFRERMYDKLGLTADQKSKVDAILDSRGASLKQLHEQMRANTQKLHSIKPDDPNYAATVSEVSQSNGSLMSQSITAEADVRAQVYAVLTPAQRTQLESMEAKMHDRMRDGRHWRHGPPPPEAG